MNAVDLLPCPFCGKAPHVSPVSGGMMASCDPCMIDMLVPEWNRRAPVSAGKVKALAEAMELVFAEEIRDWSTGHLTDAKVAGAQAAQVIRRRFREVVAALQPGDGWQDISSAPKDGTRLLAFQAGRPICEVWWDDVSHDFPDWNDDGDGEPRPTHWMPLPAPPASLPQGDETR